MKYLLYTSETCVPCKNIKKRISENSSHRDLIKEIDIFDNIDLTRQRNIRSAPTLIVLKDNVEIERHIGEGKILEFLSEL